MVDCPICGNVVKSRDINPHIDSGCQEFLDTASPPLSQVTGNGNTSKSHAPLSNFFQTPAAKRTAGIVTPKVASKIEPLRTPTIFGDRDAPKSTLSRKRSFDDVIQDAAVAKEAERPTETNESIGTQNGEEKADTQAEPPTKKPKANAFQKAAPLAERM